MRLRANVVILAVAFFSCVSVSAQMNSDVLFVGSNDLGETGPTYLASTFCGVTTPTTTAAIGFPEMQMILEVNTSGGDTLSQSVDNTLILSPNSVACQDMEIPAGNSYYRSFNLATQGVSAPFDISSIDLGIELSLENADGMGPDMDGFQPIAVRFYWSTPVGAIVHDGIAGPSGFDAGFDFLLIADGTIDQTVQNVPVTGVTVPSGATDLVVEIFQFGFDTTLQPDFGGGDGCEDPSELTPFRGNPIGTPTVGDFAGPDGTAASYNPGFVLNNLEAPVWVILDFANAATGFVEVTSQAGTPGLEMTIEYFDGNQFQVVGTASESFNSFSTETFPLGGVSADRIRVGWRQAGFVINFPWQVDIDAVLLCQ